MQSTRNEETPWFALAENSNAPDMFGEERRNVWVWFSTLFWMGFLPHHPPRAFFVAESTVFCGEMTGAQTELTLILEISLNPPTGTLREKLLSLHQTNIAAGAVWPSILAWFASIPVRSTS